MLKIVLVLELSNEFQTNIDGDRVVLLSVIACQLKTQLKLMHKERNVGATCFASASMLNCYSIMGLSAKCQNVAAAVACGMRRQLWPPIGYEWWS